MVRSVIMLGDASLGVDEVEETVGTVDPIVGFVVV
jgi:hypothetical protein